MRILMTLTAAMVGTAAIVSSASAESRISCDPSEPTMTLNAASCRLDKPFMSSGPYAYAPAGGAYAAVPARGWNFGPRTGHRNPNRTDISGGSGN
jgi:hypothetical protein